MEERLRTPGERSTFVSPVYVDLRLSLKLSMCTSLVSLRPETHLSDQGSIPKTDLEGIGRQEKPSCVYLANRREKPPTCLGVSPFGWG